MCSLFTDKLKYLFNRWNYNNAVLTGVVASSLTSSSHQQHWRLFVYVKIDSNTSSYCLGPIPIFPVHFYFAVCLLPYSPWCFFSQKTVARIEEDDADQPQPEEPINNWKFSHIDLYGTTNNKISIMWYVFYLIVKFQHHSLLPCSKRSQLYQCICWCCCIVYLVVFGGIIIIVHCYDFSEFPKTLLWLMLRKHDLFNCNNGSIESIMGPGSMEHGHGEKKKQI